ncbi:hypothetical protein ACQCVK_04740 [Rossellomorea vietnamensis]|uniref:Uncharacterized protein n=1 Tax=Rossellomorea aquimaris TaxID=189382 RepID=A0A5D4TUR8_9BACI|nr:hypothetical protein [Rossellomorea aquimaris]TYS79397.1 hypothetical protein FZC80_10820 [Rossellomorea aquimaris]
MTPLPDEGIGFQNIRVYYGKTDGGLEKYEEYTSYESQITSVDEYRGEWFDDKVSINIMKKNQDFELYIYDTIQLILTSLSEVRSPLLADYFLLGSSQSGNTGRLLWKTNFYKMIDKNPVSIGCNDERYLWICI